MLGVDVWGSGGDPKLILLVTFVDWAKIFLWHTNERTDGRTVRYGQTDELVEIVI